MGHTLDSRPLICLFVILTTASVSHSKKPKNDGKPVGKLEAALFAGSEFPKVKPDIPVLSVPEQLAASARILAHSGFALDVAGHITAKRPGGDGTMWCTPYGVFWRDIIADDILVINESGDVVEGKWDVTPATAIHTELHQSRPDVEVVVHNHPYYGSLLSALHVIPEIADQQAIMFDGDIGFFSEYTGAVDNVDDGRKLAKAIGTSTAILLANHGVLITGESVAQATYRAVTFERTCRLQYDALAAGKQLVPVPNETRALLKRSLNTISVDSFWRNEVRNLVRKSPEVFDTGKAAAAGPSCAR